MTTTSVNQVNNATPVQQRQAATKLQALFRGRSVRNINALKEKYPTCVICMENFEPADRVVRFTCSGKHIFHTECAQELANNDNKCPYDRELNVNPIGNTAPVGRAIVPLQPQRIARVQRQPVQLTRIQTAITVTGVLAEVGLNVNTAIAAGRARMSTISNPLQVNPDIAGIATATLAGIAVMAGIQTVTFNLVEHLKQVIERHPGEDPIDLIAVPIFRAALLVGAIVTINSFGLGE